MAVVADGLRQIAGQQVVERGNVGRTLNTGMAAQREDPASRTPDVAEQGLQDTGGANDLNACRVLRPADRVADRAGPLASRIVTEQLCRLYQLFGGASADFGHGFGRIAGKMAAQQLHHAVRVLQRFVAWRLAARFLRGLGALRGMRAGAAHDAVPMNAMRAVLVLGGLIAVLGLSAVFILLLMFVRRLAVQVQFFVAPVAFISLVLAGLRVVAAEHAVEVFRVLKAPSISVEALVYARTYSLNQRS